MSLSHVSFLPELAVLTQPIQKTLVYSLWYAALFWIPIRVFAALVDRRKLRIERVVDQPATDESYRIGMEILPPL